MSNTAPQPAKALFIAVAGLFACGFVVPLGNHRSTYRRFACYLLQRKTARNAASPFSGIRSSNMLFRFRGRPIKELCDVGRLCPVQLMKSTNPPGSCEGLQKSAESIAFQEMHTPSYLALRLHARKDAALRINSPLDALRLDRAAAMRFNFSANVMTMVFLSLMTMKRLGELPEHTAETLTDFIGLVPACDEILKPKDYLIAPGELDGFKQLAKDTYNISTSSWQDVGNWPTPLHLLLHAGHLLRLARIAKGTLGATAGKLDPWALTAVSGGDMVVQVFYADSLKKEECPHQADVFREFAVDLLREILDEVGLP